MTDEAQDKSGERMVGCETDDGLIITHPERLYCEVCRFHGDEAQGIKVVAEGEIVDQLLPGNSFAWVVETFEGTDLSGFINRGDPVLIVRDTPEARRALGIEPREAEASREGSKET